MACPAPMRRRPRFRPLPGRHRKQTTERSRLRITAESSTIRIRVRRAGAIDSGLHQAEHGQLFAQRLVVEGLHQVFVGAGIQGAHDDSRFRPRWSPSCTFMSAESLGAQLLQHLQAVHHRHVPVHQRKVEGAAADGAAPGRPGRRRLPRTRCPALRAGRAE